MRIKDVMTRAVITVRENTPLKDVAATLIDHAISAAPVVDDHGDLIGIVSEADLIPLETDPDPTSHILPLHRRIGAIPRTAGDVMTRHVITLQQDADTAEAARLMVEVGVKRIVIVSGTRVIGIVSRRDVLRILARADDDIRRDLEDILEDEMFMLRQFHGDVSGGVITLSGPPDPPRRRLIELLARSIPGVVLVTFDRTPAASQLRWKAHPSAYAREHR